MSSYIFESISTCSYPINTKDYIGSVILELYNMNKTTKFYKVNKDGDKILVAQYKIQVTFKGKNYDTPILIYFPKDFPKIPPEVFVETKSDVAINPNNKDIDTKTKKISLSCLRGWNNYSTIKGLILDCTNSFNKTFPVFKVTTNNNQNSSSNTDLSLIKGLEECFMDQGKSSNNEINFQWNTTQNNDNNFYSSYNNNNNNNNILNILSNNNTNNNNNIAYPGESTSNSNINSNKFDFTSYNKNNNNLNQPIYNNPGNLNINNNVNTSNPFSGFLNNNNNNYSNYSNNNNNISTNNNNNNYNTGFNNLKINYQVEIKKKLVEELKKSIESKLKDEVQNLQNTKSKLLNYKSGMISLKEKYSTVLLSKPQVEENIMNKISQMNDEISKLKISIIQCKDNVMTENNYEKFIKIKGNELIRACAVEATLEDILMTLKKNFERGNISLEESVKLYRQLTKEIVKVKSYKLKMERFYRK